ncbi:hypothetical protein L9F63_014673, partial [Diploptera punctata]
MSDNSMPGPSRMSPVKKHKQGNEFHSGEKQTIINVYKTLLKENPHTAIRDYYY